MKNKFLILVGVLICINSCRMPSNPLGEIKIIKRLETIYTEADCLDLDVDMDIGDSVLVAAANYNGYFIYRIKYDGENISKLDVINHLTPNDMDTYIGDNRAQQVVLSKNHNIAFILDQYDHLWLWKYDDDANQYGPPNYIDEDCFGGTWFGVAIDDQPESVRIFNLVKHSRAEYTPFCYDEVNKNEIQDPTLTCADIENMGYKVTEHYDIDSTRITISEQTSCILNGYLWDDIGCRAGEFNDFSTSLVWKNLEDVDPMDNTLNGEPDCENIANQSIVADKIFFSDSLLTMGYGELGVQVYKQSALDACVLDDNSILYIEDNTLCNYHIDIDGTIDYKSCCENDPCPNETPDCANDPEKVEVPGYGGKFSSSGGVIRKIFSEFPTIRPVESVFSEDNMILIGLSDREGCKLFELNFEGGIVSTQKIADGYTIKGIHIYEELLVLAAGYDGILVFNWQHGNPVFLGQIETSFANSVKIHKNSIFVATRDGIEIIQIDR
jgi:hypothetical protein